MLAETEPDRAAYLAVPSRVHTGVLSEQFGRTVIARLKLRLLVFDELKGKVLQWIESNDTEKP